MIKYSDAELISVLPPYLKNSADVQAVSYAFRMAMSKVIRFSVTTSLYANVDNLDEDLLDLMALELRTQYYDEDMDIQTKRKLIKNTLAWYKKAGTPAAVAELVAVAFGEGKVEEWFEYGGDPYMFRIVTNASLTPEMNALFDQMIKKVKNTRSHLESITIIRTIRQTLYAGVGRTSYSRPPAVFEGGYQADRRVESTIVAGSAQQARLNMPAIMEGHTLDRWVAMECNASTGTATALIKPEAIKQI